MGLIILQFLASTAGISLLVAISSGIANAISDHGARQGVTAAKEAQDLYSALPAGDARSEIVRIHRDQEILRLGLAVERAELRATRGRRWQRSGSRGLRSILAACLGGLFGAVFVFFVGGSRPTDWGFAYAVETIWVLVAASILVAGVMAVVALARHIRQRRQPSAISAVLREFRDTLGELDQTPSRSPED